MGPHVRVVVGDLIAPVFRRTQNIPEVQMEAEGELSDEVKTPSLRVETREPSATAPTTPNKRSGRRRRRRKGRRSGQRQTREKLLSVVLVIAALAVAILATPQAVQADGHWLDDIDYEPAEPVPGRRFYFEDLHVSDDQAEVSLRAATGVKLRVRAYGGPSGNELRFFGIANVAEGEAISYSLPLSGDSPSLTFSWEDGIGQAGAFAIEEAQLPFPLPEIDGDMCDLKVTALGWTPGTIEGTVESECAVAVEEAVELQSVAGHANIVETAVMEAEVAAVVGTIAVTSGASRAQVPFVPDGQTAFSLPVATGEAIHPVTIGVDLEASLSVPIPPLVTLTHSPQRTEYRTETVRLLRPGTSETVSKTVTVTHEDGTQTQHVVSATLSIPSETVYRDVTLTIVHPERVEAEIVEREPLTPVRQERLTLHASVGSDDPFAVFTTPQSEPEVEKAEQRPLTEEEANILFDLWGWGRPW